LTLIIVPAFFVFSLGLWALFPQHLPPSESLLFSLYIYIIIIVILTTGKSSGGSKIIEVDYEICVVVNPTPASRHQRNHHASKMLHHNGNPLEQKHYYY